MDRARRSHNFMQQNKIGCYDLPSLPPDIAPIELVIDELGRRLRGRTPPPAKLPQLRRALLKEWQNIQ